MKVPLKFAFLFTSAVNLLVPGSRIVVDAVKSCNSDLDCVGSSCDSGKCTNPFFEKGCLATLAERDGRKLPQEEFSIRVCNSDDEAAASADYNSSCLEPRYNYTEIRIGSGDFEASVMVGWIYQIFLSEILGVPSTIDGNSLLRDSTFSFYDRKSRFVMPSEGYPLDQLVQADRYDGDCSQSELPCSHIFPLVLERGIRRARSFDGNASVIEEGLLGTSAHSGLYMSRQTLDRYPDFASYTGLQGESNRELLASIFKTPTNWTDYCKDISASNCMADDGVAKRAPANDEEGKHYFVEGEYTGYFRDNDCGADENCTGTVIAPPCYWSHSYIETQMYWNDIHLSSKGPLGSNGGYEGDFAMNEIYQAANATQSDIFFWWYGPDPLFEAFEGTNHTLEAITFPRPTAACIDYRSSDSIDNCSPIKSRRVGSLPTGSCDNFLLKPIRLTSKGVVTDAESLPAPIRSPAYAYLKHAIIPQYTLESIFLSWNTFRKDDNIVDSEREGVCRWVYDHLDDLMENKPRGYPRTFETVTFVGLSFVGLVLGIIALLTSITAGALMCRWREERPIKISQVPVMSFVILGHILLAMAGITESSDPTNATCVMAQWFIRLGYTLALGPILIKISAINRISINTTDGSINTDDRIQTNALHFRNIFSTAVFALVIFLSLWTVFDRPYQDLEYFMDDEENGFVEVHIGCVSRTNAWEIAALSWEGVLLFAASILTYQSQHMLVELNESLWFAVTVYSHLLFLVMRLLLMMLMFSRIIPSDLAMKILSLLLSFDVLLSMGLYFGPKFYEVIKEGNDQPHRISSYFNDSIRTNRFSRTANATEADRTPVAASQLVVPSARMPLPPREEQLYVSSDGVGAQVASSEDRLNVSSTDLGVHVASSGKGRLNVSSTDVGVHVASSGYDRLNVSSTDVGPCIPSSAVISSQNVSGFDSSCLSRDDKPQSTTAESDK